MVYIVGLGPGHKDYILPKAIEVMRNCDLILGFKRALESLDFIDNEKEAKTTLKGIIDALEENPNKNIAVVASGDPNFYGITDFINRNYPGDLEVIPGISSYQYLMGRINRSWQGAYLSSVHGRNEDFISKVREHKKSIWLTDKERNPKELSRLLIESKIECQIVVGENLSYEDEKITQGSPSEIFQGSYSSLSIVFIDLK